MAITDQIKNEIVNRLDNFLNPARQAYIKAANHMDSIENALSGLGGDYDKGQAWQIVRRRQLSRQELDALYEQNAYCRRYIDLMSHDMTRKGWSVLPEGEGEDAMAEENKRLNVQFCAMEALKWSYLYGGYLVYPVIKEVRPTELWEPLDLNNIKSIDNIVGIVPEEASPVEWDKSIISPTFKDPLIWQINLSVAGMGTSLKIHASRLIYFDGQSVSKDRKPELNGFGLSKLEAALNNINIRTSIDQMIAHLIQEFKQDVISIPELKGLATSAQKEAFNLRLKAFVKSKSLINAIVLGPGETYDTRQVPVAGFADLADRAAQSLSAAFAIPQAKLYGEPPSGLNTDNKSQEQNWNAVISAGQSLSLAPQLYRLYDMIFAAKKGPFKGVIPKKYEIKFNSIYEPNQEEIAKIQKLHAETDQIRVSNGIIMPEEARSRFAETGYQDQITLKEISEDELNSELDNLNKAYQDISNQNEDQPEDNNGVLFIL